MGLLRLFFLALIVSLSACATRQAPPPATVSQVDLKRYAGKWYEIAAYPAWFQRNCAGGTTAEYTPLEDGTIRVVNQCWTKDGKLDRVEGTAWPIAGSNGSKLNVRFFWPITAPYWIIGLDEKDYQWAVVSEPSRRFLWILSRTPNMPQTTYDRILAMLKSKNYDVSKLQPTNQKDYPIFYNQAVSSPQIHL